MKNKFNLLFAAATLNACVNTTQPVTSLNDASDARAYTRGSCDEHNELSTAIVVEPGNIATQEEIAEMKAKIEELQESQNQEIQRIKVGPLVDEAVGIFISCSSFFPYSPEDPVNVYRKLGRRMNCGYSLTPVELTLYYRGKVIEATYTLKCIKEDVASINMYYSN